MTAIADCDSDRCKPQSFAAFRVSRDRATWTLSPGHQPSSAKAGTCLDAVPSLTANTALLEAKRVSIETGFETCLRKLIAKNLIGL